MKLIGLSLPFFLLAAAQSGPTATHVFPAPGKYPVTLNVCNSSGCSSVTKFVTVLDPRPAPPIVALPSRVGSAQLSTPLVAQSAGGRPPLSWTWSVSRAGRTLSLSGNPALWSFDSLGQHEVKATARNAWGSSPSPAATVEVVPSTFHDVSPTSWAFDVVETLAALGIGAGCSNSPRAFCPDRPVSRAEAAVLLAATAFGPLERLPPAAGTFADVPRGHWAGAAIEQLARMQVTSGCSLAPPRFCPEEPTTRAAIAVLLVRALRGASFTPPPAVGRFLDIQRSFWAAPYIEQLARDGITLGCSLSPALYCPDQAVTRAQLAAFLVAGFRLSASPSPTIFAPKMLNTFATQTPVVFLTEVRRGIPSSYEYDWNGDGIFEEISPLPVLSHTYTQPGTYTPVLRLRKGSHVAQLASPPLRILSATSLGVPSLPSGLRATFRELRQPGPADPAGALPRLLFQIEASSSRALGFNAYVALNGTSFRLIDALPPGGGLLAVPLFSATETATLQLRPFNQSGLGPSSLALRLTRP